ncbi:MAG: L-threonylcarbamoyladenylate synthase [Candidatus Krumholzibacteriota bacterium]|nr:L-threonylcarbamoyladenylate synthase [Candidatus Krumholzibacteriota bacterium]
MEKTLRGYFEYVGINVISELLAEGDIAVLPTDTIYGFHCLAVNRSSVEKVLSLKGNRKSGGFVLLFSNIRMADGWVSSWRNSSRGMLSSIWPAPLTAVLPASKFVDPLLTHRKKVAIRIPAKKQLRDIIDILGYPLVSTSVNKTGCKPLTRISEIITVFPGLGAYISRKGRTPVRPSTIVEFGIPTPKVLRHGAYNWSNG